MAPISHEEIKKRNAECQRNRRAKKLYLEDLTREQLLEIVDLVFPFPKAPKTEIIINHFNGDFGQWIDLREKETTITFEARIRYHIPEELWDTVIVRITPCLSVYTSYKYTGGTMADTNPLTCRNQYRVQKKFAEWKITPQFVFD